MYAGDKKAIKNKFQKPVPAMYQLSYFLSNQESIIPVTEGAMVFSSVMFWF